MMNNVDTEYLATLEQILKKGNEKTDRTGTGTKSIFGLQMRFDLSKGFPLLTTKQVHFKSVMVELLFFLSGQTNTKFLMDHDVKIWNEWTDINGNLGPIYSHQWRNFGGKHKNRKQPIPSHKPTLGNYKLSDDEVERKLYVTWRGIVNRTYNQSKDTYKHYGGKGVYMCERWLMFENFLKDAKLIDGWDKKLSNWSDYQLDKDIIGDGFCYGPQTCIWASKNENMQAKLNKIYTIAHEDGRTEQVTNPNAFIKINGYSQGNFSAMLRGERKIAHGWTLLGVVDLDKGKDQIQQLINDLKSNKDSRRLVVNAWNVSDLEFMALPPCHYEFQCYVSDGKLSLKVEQRSADMFLGVPFNIASYALLTHLLAQVCGYEVGELIWNGGDCHIYNNHIEQCKEQLQRAKDGKIHPLPTLWINPDIDDIDQFTVDDIRIQNYQHEPKIKAEVAV